MQACSSHTFVLAFNSAVAGVAGQLVGPPSQTVEEEEEEEEENVDCGSLSEYESSSEEEGSSDAEAEAVADAVLAAAPTMCAVCGEQPHKYCCPGCSSRTCSLACSKQHKSSTGCTGQRDRLAYVPLQSFNDKQLLSGNLASLAML